MSGERSSRIVVNGQEYQRVEDMPPEVRELYERALRLAAEPGEPEAATALPPLPDQTRVTVHDVTTTVKYVVNGQEYESLAEMPPEIAAAVRRATPSDAQGAGAGDAAAAAARRPAAPPTVAAGPKFSAGDLRVRVRMSPLRLALWALAILFIIYLYLRRR